jgi:hypothetical protein
MFLVPAVIVIYTCVSGPCYPCQAPLSLPAVPPPLFGVGPGAVARGVRSAACGDRVACVCGDRALREHPHALVVVYPQS